MFKSSVFLAAARGGGKGLQHTQFSVGPGAPAALPVKAGRGGLLVFVAFQRKRWDSDIEVGAVGPLKSESAPAK